MLFKLVRDLWEFPLGKKRKTYKRRGDRLGFSEELSQFTIQLEYCGII